mmetsp:Transcript_13469/g.32939  ORF Transcript_13469/g.32939 Transcript_13469/m.32939 type:complete len:212 (+) Transcript_13469:310-945(+)
MAAISFFLRSKSRSRSLLPIRPASPLSRKLSERSESLSCLAFVRASRCVESSASSSASSTLRSWFSACTNCSFSLRCVRTCTVVVVFLRSLSSSSLRSSIFSLSVWFSILSCSKSIKCSSLDSSSLRRRFPSSLRSWLRRWMFLSRTFSSSSSFLRSCSSNCRRSFGGIRRPVPVPPGPPATSALRAAKPSRSSRTLSCFCSRRVFMSRAM